MGSDEFISSVIKLAERLLKRPLTQADKKRLFDNFKNSDVSESLYLRAIDALEKTFNVDLPKLPGYVIIEKAASFDNINIKLQDMEREAEKWEEELRNTEKDE